MIIHGISRLIRKIRQQRRFGAAFLLAILAVSIVGNTVSFYFFERGNFPELSVWDSLWYSVISITTIGYGDFSATSAGARIGTVVFITVIGLVAFTTTVGLSVDWMVDIRHKERTGMGRPRVKDHLVIVNFPSELRIRQIINEFTRDAQHSDGEIVLVTDQVSELPFAIPNVSFVRGSPLEQETFSRANIGQAKYAIVLSPGYDDQRSDSWVASITFVIEHMSPQTIVIAECLDPKHAVLFNTSTHVSRVYTVQVANNLLVQEAQDPGVTLLTQAITSNVVEIEETLASTVVGTIPVGTLSYIEIAKRLLDHDINLVGVVRDNTIVVGLQGLKLEKYDALVYIAKTRQSWSSLLSFLA